MPELVHKLMGHAHCTSGAPAAPRSPPVWPGSAKAQLPWCAKLCAGGTEGVLSVERLCTGRVGLTCFCPLFHHGRLSGDYS